MKPNKLYIVSLGLISANLSTLVFEETAAGHQAYFVQALSKLNAVYVYSLGLLLKPVISIFTILQWKLTFCKLQVLILEFQFCCENAIVD